MSADVEAGTDCYGKTFSMGSKGIVAGGVFGTVEACLLPPAVLGSTAPLVFKALRVILGRTALGGAVGGAFASTACLSARVRNKDDYKNALVGGVFAGSVFGIVARSIPVGLGLGFGIGVTVASIKYMHGTYFPPLPPRGATLQEPYPPTIK